MFWHSCFFLFAKKRKRATAVARESFFFKRKGVLFREEKYQKSARSHARAACIAYIALAP